MESLEEFIGDSQYRVCETTDYFGRVAEKRLSLIALDGSRKLQLKVGMED